MKIIFFIFLINLNFSFAKTETPDFDVLYKLTVEQKTKSKTFFNGLLDQYYKKNDPNFMSKFEKLISKIIFLNDKNSQFYGKFVEDLVIHESNKGNRFKKIISNIVTEYEKYQKSDKKEIWTNGHRILLISSIQNRFHVPNQIKLLPFSYSNSIESNLKSLNTKRLDLYGLRLLDMLREDTLLEDYLVKKSSNIKDKCQLNILKGRLLLRKGIFNSAQDIFKRNSNTSKKHCLIFSKLLESYSALLQNKKQESSDILIQISQIKTNSDSENVLKNFFMAMGNFYIAFKENKKNNINSTFNDFKKLIEEKKHFKSYDTILTIYLAYAIKFNDRKILEKSLDYYKKAIKILVDTKIAKEEITPFFELAKLKLSGKDISSKKKLISDSLRNNYGKSNKSAFLISHL